VKLRVKLFGQGGYALPGVCLSAVSLLATLRKTTNRHLRENFTTDVSLDKEVTVKFWNSSESGSGPGNFFNGVTIPRQHAVHADCDIVLPNSVCPSVCPMPVVCQNEWTCRHTFFITFVGASFYFIF